MNLGITFSSFPGSFSWFPNSVWEPEKMPDDFYMRDEQMKKLWMPLLPFVLLAGGLAQPAWGSDLDRVVRIIEVIKNRQDGYNPVDFHYKVERLWTKYDFAAMRRIDPADRRLFAELHDARTVIRGHYSAKGDRSLIAVEGPSISAEGKVGEMTHGSNVYNGTLLKATGGDGKVVQVSRKKPNFEKLFTSCNYEDSLVDMLYGIRKGEKPIALAVTDNPSDVPSAAVHFRIVFGKGEDEFARDVWVSSAEKGHTVLRAEQRVGGILFHVYSDCEYKMADGIWYPFKTVYRNYYHDKNMHQLAKEERFEIERITFRADEIPDSQFDIPITNETELIDRDRDNLHIVGPDKVDQHILEAVADVERERTDGGWRSWIYAVGSILLLLGALYLGIRIVLLRRRAKTAAK